MELPDGISLEEWRNWPEAAQQKALDLLEAKKNPPKIWYCKRGRSCDGRPHDGADYPHARGDQWPPEGVDWANWVVVSGRGSGKTRLGAEWLRKMSSKVPYMAMVGRRGVDVRSTMVEGPSGLISVCERAGMTYNWEPSKRKFTFSNGAIVTGYSAEEPDSLRGPQQGLAWLDEPAHMPFIDAVWDNLLLGLRLDGVPGGAKALITSTPTPIQWLKDLVSDPKSRVVRVSTYKNLDNLDPTFRDNILAKYEGTRLGRQELHGEILEDVEGALWTWDLIEQGRYTQEGTLEQFAEQMDRIVIGIDPAGTSRRKSDETGIVVVGKQGNDMYILADASGRYTPERWARRAIDLYDHWSADAIVAERNYGGEMVRAVLDNISAFPRVREVNSTRGKLARAEPVFSLYEQDRVHHLPGLNDLETQLCFPGWVEVTTDRGQVPIDQVTTDDLVLTREGWAPLTFAGQTGVATKLTRVTHSEGWGVESTACHKIWTQESGFVDAESVQVGSHLAALTTLRPQSPTGATGTGSCRPATTATPPASHDVGDSCTGTSTKTTSDRSLMGCSYTTSTTTRGTTTQATSSSSPLPSTTDSTTGRGPSGKRLSSGDPSTPATPGRSASLVLSSAQGAEPSSSQSGCAPCTAPSRVDGVTTVSLARSEPVYDLTVGDGFPHEFFANGVLVHNCEWVPGEGKSPDRMDALVHAVHELTEHNRPAQITTASGLIIPSGTNKTRIGRTSISSVPGRVTRPQVRSWT